MNLKRNIKKLFSYLLLTLFSLTLFTACAPEDVEFAADVLNAVLETQLEDSDTSKDAETEDFREVIPEEVLTEEESFEEETTDTLDEDGRYTTKEDVAEYIHTYGHLPSNFITKKEAKKLGWVNSEGNLDEVAPGMSIGGDYFGNYEGLLPEADDRDYYECDIDFDGTYRNAKRIVYSNDGLVYYTEDHYESFELLYGEE